ncbi:MAG TPA: hypothetical protein VFU71_17285, partial [Burkholderiaceae bacterium]|nr:hypothetical protein [Burkholderiaceae bacterium]
MSSDITAQLHMPPQMPQQRHQVPSALARVAAADWARVASDLDGQGAAVIERLLTPAECEHLAS